MDISLYNMYLKVSDENNSLSIMSYSGGILFETSPKSTTFVLNNDKKGINHKIFSVFKSFITELIGSYHLNDGHQNDRVQIDFESNTITIKTDKYSNDYFKITYANASFETINIELILDEKHKQNRVFLDFNGCLKYKYIPAFRNLLKGLIDIKMEHHVNLAMSRKRRINDGN